ncbi:hypothetical protein HDU93_008355 [Gonapodya sp. JEL0774]|nr:hypothetical protein HDU93_008355 [Gonapodya sp. JEL0774]
MDPLSSTTLSPPVGDRPVSMNTTEGNPTGPKEVLPKEKDTKREARVELRRRNVDASALEKSREEYAASKSLDTSFKRCAAFTKKLRTSLGAESAPSLLKDISQLRLDKYAEEMAQSIAETRVLKNTAEVWAAAEVASAAHQRLPDFASMLGEALFKTLKDTATSAPDSTTLAALTEEQREKDEAARLSKLRSLLRVIVELSLVGVLRDPEPANGALSKAAALKAAKEALEGGSGSEPIVVGALKILLNSDKDFAVAPLLTTFARFYLDYFPDSQPENTSPTPIFSTAFASNSIRNLLTTYHTSMSRHLVASYHRVREMAAGLKEHAIARGHVHEERQERYDTTTRKHEKLLANVRALSEALGLPMPELPVEEAAVTGGLGGSGEIKFGATGRGEDGDSGQVSGMWEDDETRRFYEDVVDLADRVPQVLLGIGQKQKDGPLPMRGGNGDSGSASAEPRRSDNETDVNGASGRNNDSVDDNRQPSNAERSSTKVDDFDTPEPIPDIPDDASLSSAESGEDSSPPLSDPTTLTLPTLMARLPDLGSRSQADQFAVDFCYLGTKNARKRLVKEVVELPWEKTAAVPYVARVVAEVGKYVVDVKSKVVEGVEKEFHRQLKKRGFVEERVRTVRLICELTKFRVAPPHLAFHCLKVLLDTFTGNNVDVLCALVEGIGRWLLGGGAGDDGTQRMKSMLDVMLRKKNAQHMDNRQVMMIENAYYQAVPPERPAISAKPRTPLQLFLRHVFYAVLSKTTVERVLKILRKLDWDDPQVVRLLENTHFRKVWKVRYGNVHLVAFLASELARWHPDFGVCVVDGVLEEIRVGLERNIFKHNQQRIATAKYLGELYNYRMVESSVIFDTLYTVLTFGHGGSSILTAILLPAKGEIIFQGRPRPDVFVPLDPPTDFFRVRLVATLLDTCGRTFDSGLQAKKLGAFLTFFQVYLLSKQQPVPRDVEFTVDELFEELRPQARRFDSYEEASEVFEADLAEELRKQGEGDAQNDAEDSESEVGDSKVVARPAEGDGGDDAGGDGYGAGSERGSHGDGGGESDMDQSSQIGDPDAEPDLVVYIEEPADAEPTKEEEEEFDRTIREMMTLGIEERRGERRPAQFDASLPIRKGKRQAGTSSESEGERPPDDPSEVQFTFLTKTTAKGRPAPRAISVPVDSSFVQAAAAKREQEREEQARMKELVLGYEKREQEAEALALGLQTGWSQRIQKLASQMSNQIGSEGGGSRGGKSKRGGTTVVRIVSSNSRRTGGGGGGGSGAGESGGRGGGARRDSASQPSAPGLAGTSSSAGRGRGISNGNVK